MPTFKLNGKTYSGSTSYASAIEYIEKDGTKTTVQDKIDEQNKKFDNFKCGSESLVTNSTGIYTVTFDKPMLSENYVLNITQAIGSSELITGASVILTEKTINGFTFRLTRTSAIASNLPFAIEWLAISL